MTEHSLHAFFSPRTVAVVGASKTVGSIGHTAIRNFADIGFLGSVYAVNPRYEEVEGFPCYPSLQAIDDEIEVVIVAVASHLVEGAIRDCIEKHVKYIVIFSSGFAEISEDGRQKQDDLFALCKEKGIRVLGPNTLGTYNNFNKVAFSFMSTSVLKQTPEGDVGIVSQSGASGGTLFMAGGEEGIGYSYLATTGNQMDMNTCEFLDFLVDDDRTNVIGLYMEAIPDGKSLMQAAERAIRKRKPIVALKAGRSDSGAKAALTHTASMTGSYQVFQAALDRYGVTFVEELDEMADAIKAFRSGKQPSGNRVALLVGSGATGIMLADRLDELGLRMAQLRETTVQRLAEMVPSYCFLGNPVDIASTYTGNDKLYRHCVETLAAAEEVDIVIAHLPMPGPMGHAMADDIISVSEQTGKPIIVALTSTEKMQGDIKVKLNCARIPAYFTLRGAAKAAWQLVNYEEKRSRAAVLTELRHGQTAIAAEALEGQGVVTEPEVKTMLREFGIPVPKGFVAANRLELLEGAKGLQYPVAVKIVSPDITHKSDAGGVILKVADEQALVEAFETVLRRVKEHEPNASVHGVLVEEMVEGPFLEAIVGVKRDPAFGPIVMCGLGGIYVEVLKDVVQKAAPLTPAEALEMIQALQCYPLFTGARKGLAYDVDALANVISKISELAVSLGDRWDEMEINPLIVRPQGQGVMALDGLITK
ncbi:acetate--CoA ligase family protein [Paenibacillus sp.]|uniref:acetate--CoA ligase family protein n=1 Tax=Paenibacillus sp. TaxID=58172 RepID=UPI002D59DD06|nr:acetate--CoA ligase family protein [Paenibacillus sp.]HZG83755.1 acetate--CoA ligase family protein [Paenibacillus sp.]